MKGFASSYLNKQRLLNAAITQAPSAKTGFIIVIPALCEPDITSTLESLWKCDRPSCDTEVIIVVNASENAPLEVLDCNRRTFGVALDWIEEHHDESMRFYILNVILRARDAGVGLARKIGMDEALRRFDLAGNNHGFILSFDADSLCDVNYLSAIEDTLKAMPATKGLNVYFEHPLYGSGFDGGIYDGIIQYELHLRYVNLYLKYSDFPYAKHTIGSCFGVRADVYAAQGGMNKRKGGEDFYFLHKIIPLGNFEEINSTRVIPSPRASLRVPFGTGPVIRRLAESGQDMLTYDPLTFRALKDFFQMVPLFRGIQQDQIKELINGLPENMKQFLEKNDYIGAIEEINGNSGSPETFRKRFYNWFDAFRVIKYLNYSAMNHLPKQKVGIAVNELLKDLKNEPQDKKDPMELLLILRKIERAGCSFTSLTHRLL
jgi:hypothetical protein